MIEEGDELDDGAILDLVWKSKSIGANKFKWKSAKNSPAVSWAPSRGEETSRSGGETIWNGDDTNWSVKFD